MLLCLLFATVTFSVKAGAIAIDGNIENLEWKYAVATELFPHGSNTNCDINFAFMRVHIDEKAKAVFLGFLVTQKAAGAFNAANTSSGVKLDMGVGKEIICRIDGTNSFDKSTYSVTQKMVVGTNNDIVIEIRIGYLFGVPTQPLIGLQLIDSYGKYSNYHSFPIVVEATTQNTATTRKKPTTTKKPITTKPTTAKPNPSTSTAVVQTTSGGGSVVKNGTTTTIGNPVYTVTDPSRVDENSGNVAAIHDEATNSLQSNSDKPDGNSEGEVFPNYDTNEKDSNQTKKQIAAVVTAVVLLSLAAYFFILASKHKTQPKPEPENPEEKADDDLDDDF